MDINIIKDKLFFYLHKRYEYIYQKDLNSFLKGTTDYEDLDPVFINFLIENKDQVIEAFNDEPFKSSLAFEMAKLAKQYTYSYYQFIYTTKEYEAYFIEEYNFFMSGFINILRKSSKNDLKDNVKEVMTIHLSRIYKNFKILLKNQFNYDIKHLPKTVCHEYSPKLQIELLGINLKNLVEPVLDLGCGSKGLLVNYLNELGINAKGVDRIAPSSDNFISMDWCEINFEKESIGTIISHHAFSTHFIYNHEADYKKAVDFTKKYMEILDAIKEGGSFHYAPGLPFVEGYLEKNTNYQISKKEIEINGDYKISPYAYSVEIKKLDLL